MLLVMLLRWNCDSALINQDSQLSGQKTGSFRATAQRWLDRVESAWFTVPSAKVGSTGMAEKKETLSNQVFAYCDSLWKKGRQVHFSAEITLAKKKLTQNTQFLCLCFYVYIKNYATWWIASLRTQKTYSNSPGSPIWWSANNDEGFKLTNYIFTLCTQGQKNALFYQSHVYIYVALKLLFSFQLPREILQFKDDFHSRHISLKPRPIYILYTEYKSYKLFYLVY